MIIGVLVLGLDRGGELLWISDHNDQLDGGTVVDPWKEG